MGIPFPHPDEGLDVEREIRAVEVQRLGDTGPGLGRGSTSRIGSVSLRTRERGGRRWMLYHVRRGEIRIEL
jgi:hypothetical protein